MAAELPGEVRDELGRWARAATAQLPLRPVVPDHLHVTLCFLGWQAVSDIAAVASAIGDVTRAHSATGRPSVAGARSHDVPQLRFGEAIWLPARRPRVLAVRLEDSGARLTALQSGLSECLHTGGWYEPEQRPYLPHVTVARVGRQARVKASSLPHPPVLAFSAKRMTLFRSHLSPKGASYEALASAELG